ncbi:MAG TPA: DUF6279 family lipoprotein [Burkholderiales bacterium]
MSFARGACAAIVACFILSGCSAMRMAYENADTFLRWRLTSYLDVHGEDSDRLDDAIDAFLGWHRAEALPRYAGIADDAATRLARRLSREDLVWGYDSLVMQARESLRVAAEKLAPSLDRLDAAQIRHMESRFAEDNRKFAREYLRGSEKERRQKRLERNIERMEEWVGRLSEEQVQRVQQYSERAPLFDEHRDRERKRLQAEFLAVVRAHEAQKRLPELAANWDRGRDAEYRTANAALLREYYAMVLDIDRTLSAPQRARAVARMRAFAEDFTALASARAATPAR